MAVSLQKGGSVSLTQTSPGLRSIFVGLGWDEREAPRHDPMGDDVDSLKDDMLMFQQMAADDDDAAPSQATSTPNSPQPDSADPKAPFDLDASVFVLNRLGRVRNDGDFIFYNNLQSPCGGVRHTGDNQTGEGDGDDEVVEIDLENLPAEIERIRVVVTIHDAEQRGQHFGLVESAFMRVVNRDNGSEVARFDLTDGAVGEDALIFGEIYRDGAEWRFKAIGEGSSVGLAGLAQDVGVNIA